MTEPSIQFGQPPTVEISNVVFDDTFVSSAANYAQDTETSGTFAISDGGLVFSTIADSAIYRASGNATDFKAIIKVTPGLGSMDPGMVFKRLDGNNSLVAMLSGTGPDATLSPFVYKRVAGSYTLLTPIWLNAFTGLGAGVPFWHVVRMSGNDVVVEVWKVDPRLSKAAPVAGSYYKLAGGDATMFGAGVAGGFGIRVNNAATHKFNDYVVQSIAGSIGRGAF